MTRATTPGAIDSVPRSSAVVCLPSLGLAALASCLIVGCADGNDLGGIWHAVVPPGDVLIHDDQAVPASIGVELVIGHYGPDIAGVLRYYRSDDFIVPREPTQPWLECLCNYLHQGRYSGAVMTFTTRGCVPGSATEADLPLRGRFEFDAEGGLGGTLSVNQPDSPLYGTMETLHFERTSTAGAIFDSDLTCERPAADEGNPYNGL